MKTRTQPSSLNLSRPPVTAYPSRLGRIFSARNLVIVLAILALGIVLYFDVAWQWMAAWGATSQEITATLAGDELVPNPERVTTQAVTIRATPEQIYPWLLQLGVDRGGMYSYDELENLFGLDVYTIDHIDAKFQNVRAGDFWGFTPKNYSMQDGPGVFVTRLEPNRAVVGCFGVASQAPPPCTGTWQLVIKPQSDGTSRLILRSRTSPDSPMSGWFGRVFDGVTFIMQRGMLLGFRDRIQAANP